MNLDNDPRKQSNIFLFTDTMSAALSFQSGQENDNKTTCTLPKRPTKAIDEVQKAILSRCRSQKITNKFMRYDITDITAKKHKASVEIVKNSKDFTFERYLLVKA